MDAITITAAMVLSLFDTNIGGDQFIYNTEFNNRQEVCAKTVFKKDEEGYFRKELRYQYAYDAQKRLSAKEVQAWNPAADKWENVYRLEYRYDLTETSVTCMKWDNRTDMYSNLEDKIIYSQLDEHVLSVCNYTWDEKDSDWALVSRMAAYDPTNELLYTDNRMK